MFFNKQLLRNRPELFIMMADNFGTAGKVEIAYGTSRTAHQQCDG